MNAVDALSSNLAALKVKPVYGSIGDELHCIEEI
jgi:hypothetical protein